MCSVLSWSANNFLNNEDIESFHCEKWNKQEKKKYKEYKILTERM